MPIILTAQAVSKRFRRSLRGPTTLKETAIRVAAGKRSNADYFWALRDVTFELEKGRTLGIIGHNGAGKSTLLRLICGLGRPTEGRMDSVGSIGSLLDLGGGFHADLTGRENLMIGGLLSGLTKREVKELQDEIIGFAELEEFIDAPLRTYSSGMYLRLAFASAVYYNPDILVIDEILAVGDVNFQSKCQERLRQMKAGGTTMVIASHDMQQVLNLSDEVLVLEDGRLELHGDPDMAVRSFHELMQRRTENRKSVLAGLSKEREMPKQRGNRIGTLEASIDNVLLLNDEGRIISDMISGDGLTVELAYSLNGPVSDMNVLLGIYTDSNLKCFETHIDSMRSAFGQPAKRGCYRCRFQSIPLLPGHYFVNVGFYPLDWTYTYDYHWQQHDLFVHSSGDEADKTSTGIISLKPRWSFSEAHEKG